ncbi:solute carrier family 23 protein [Shigella flexneri]
MSPTSLIFWADRQLIRFTAYYHQESWSSSVCNTSLSCRGAVAVPLIIGDRLGLSKEAIAMLVSSISLLRDRRIFAMYRYRPLYGESPAGDYVGDLCCCNTDDSHWDEPGYGPARDLWCHYRRGFCHHIISATCRSLDALFPPLVTGVVITSIGLSIIQVGIDSAAGGEGNPRSGNPFY